MTGVRVWGCVPGKVPWEPGVRQARLFPYDVETAGTHHAFPPSFFMGFSLLSA